MHDSINAVFPAGDPAKLASSMQANITEPMYHVNLIQSQEIDRSDEILNIQQSIDELQAIFSSLHMATLGQAELVERIDRNIACTLSSNQAASVQLERAISRAKSKLTFRKFIFLILLGVIGIVIYTFS